MRARFAFVLAVAALLAGGSRGGQTPAGGEGPPDYVVLDLDDAVGSAGGTNSRGNSLNNRAWAAGYSNLSGNQVRHAALWNLQGFEDLGTLGSPSRNSVVPWPVKNVRGLLTGISQTDEPEPLGEDWSCSFFFPPATATGFTCLGFAWQNGAMRRLEPFDGGNNSFATGANNLGQIVGWAENGFHDPECNGTQVLNFKAALWEPGESEPRVLDPLPGDSAGAATAINDHGQVVGISGICDVAVGNLTAAHSVLWEKDGSVIQLPDLGGDLFNTPMAINRYGEVAGLSDLPGDLVTHAFYWNEEDGLQEILPLPLPGHVFSQANGINSWGQVVGLSCTGDFSDCHAFLWEDGELTDVNDLVVGGPDGFLLTDARDINDLGMITGRALDTSVTPNRRPAYLAVPVPGGGEQAAAGRLGTHRPHPPLSREAARELLGPLSPGRARLDALDGR